MRFVPTPVSGAWLIEIETLADERGWFARTYDAEAFATRGLRTLSAQANTSFNARAGTLRGMHFQAAPHEEAKLVRCTRGALFDVAVDLTDGRWFGVDLTPENGRQLYVGPGLAHGFVTLQDETEIAYLMSSPHVPEAAAGFRFDDPAFGIDWPREPEIVADRDRSFPPWTGAS
jgi:dTDP-4-dehydrorhamnose 3,5-epimerase